MGVLPRRIVVIGPSGAGKTSLAREICRKNGSPHIALDSLNWDNEWTRTDLATFRDRVSKAVTGDSWVIDGHYPQTRDLVWSQADLAIWLDYGLVTCLTRLAKRKGSSPYKPARNSNRPDGGARPFKPLVPIQLFFRRLLRTMRCMKERRETVEQLAEYPNLRVLRLRTPADADAWLAKLSAVVAASVLLLLCCAV